MCEILDRNLEDVWLTVQIDSRWCTIMLLAEKGPNWPQGIYSECLQMITSQFRIENLVVGNNGIIHIHRQNTQSSVPFRKGEKSITYRLFQSSFGVFSEQNKVSYMASCLISTKGFLEECNMIMIFWYVTSIYWRLHENWLVKVILKISINNVANLLVKDFSIDIMK